jgi:CRISPR/Cas system CSM-associated protein Csm3 (group 7 of RAMP superfamily)
MLSQAINELTVRLRLKAESPVLVKDGRFGDTERRRWAHNDAERERMPNAIPISHESVETIQEAMGAGTTVEIAAAVSRFRFFLPGSSLRGAWRAHLERALRSQDPPDDPKVCDPLAAREKGKTPPVDESCSSILNEQRDRILESHTAPYRVSCPVCRLFGSAMQASRLAISDAERVGTAGGIEIRDHIQIDRRTGQSRLPIRFFGLKDAQFEVEIRVRNFELWQVRLLGQLIGDIFGGKVPVGSGKSKGYGRLVGQWRKCELTWFGASPGDNRLRGIADHPKWGPQLCSDYDLRQSPVLPELPTQWKSSAPWRHDLALTLEQFAALIKQLPLDWNAVKPLSARQLPEQL